MATQSAVEDFLSQRKIAIAGVSRSGKGFGNAILKDLTRKGYEVFPVHPEADELQGIPAVKSVADLSPDVGGMVLVVPPEQTEKIVTEAAEAGIKRIWMQYGASSPEAIRLCQERGIACIHGECVMMHAKPVQSIHRVHRWLWRLLGKLPKEESSTD